MRSPPQGPFALLAGRLAGEPVCQACHVHVALAACREASSRPCASEDKWMHDTRSDARADTRSQACVPQMLREPNPAEGKDGEGATAGVLGAQDQPVAVWTARSTGRQCSGA